MGEKISLKLPVETIVCLSPAHTEMIYMLQQENKLLAVSTYCDYPPEAIKLEKAGDFLHPDIEKILKLKPSVVISGGGSQKKAIYKLGEMNIPVVVMYPGNIDGIVEDMILIGRLTGKEATAVRLADGILKSVKATSVPAGGKRVKVYAELWNNPAMAIGGSGFLNDIIERAGGANIYSDSTSEYPKSSKEEIIKKAPEVILFFYEPEKDFTERPWLKLTPAGKNNRIYVIGKKEQDIFLRPGPRCAENIMLMKKYLAGAK